jgi:hypothetical protein
LANTVVAKRHTMTKNDSTRIGKNFGYMIRNLHKLNGKEAEILKAGKSILGHQFDNHEFCGGWCPRKRMTPQQLSSSERFYRCKMKDAMLYCLLVEKVGRFTTLPRLMECAHCMDTQVNESFNNIAAWMAPKNKVYCGSLSITNRLGIAIGIKLLGLLEYFKRLFVKLGIYMSPNVVHYLKTKDKSRYARIAKNKTKDTKKARLHKVDLISRRKTRRWQRRREQRGMVPTNQDKTCSMMAVRSNNHLERKDGRIWFALCVVRAAILLHKAKRASTTRRGCQILLLLPTLPVLMFLRRPTKLRISPSLNRLLYINNNRIQWRTKPCLVR